MVLGKIRQHVGISPSFFLIFPLLAAIFAVSLQQLKRITNLKTYGYEKV